MDTAVQAPSAQSFQPGWVTGINHLALPVRNVDEALRFWTRLFGGAPYRVRAGKQTFHVQLPGVVLAFFERPGVSASGAEFPHYAFTVTPEGMRGLTRLLEEAGVATHRPWTRNRTEALMYFRDPRTICSSSIARTMTASRSWRWPRKMAAISARRSPISATTGVASSSHRAAAWHSL
jgi:catechol 2,3-dioxygenase-like lactoylglutathione lyase family enzyme